MNAVVERMLAYDREKRRFPRCGVCNRMIDDVPVRDLIQEVFWYSDSAGTHPEWRPICPNCERRRTK